MRDLVVHHLEIASDHQTKYYNHRRRDIRFKLGNIVSRKTHVLSSAPDFITKKLAPKYDGPFKVIEVFSSILYVIKGTTGNIENVHVKDLEYYWSFDESAVNGPFLRKRCPPKGD